MLLLHACVSSTHICAWDVISPHLVLERNEAVSTPHRREDRRGPFPWRGEGRGGVGRSSWEARHLVADLPGQRRSTQPWEWEAGETRARGWLVRSATPTEASQEKPPDPLTRGQPKRGRAAPTRAWSGAGGGAMPAWCQLRRNPGAPAEGPTNLMVKSSRCSGMGSGAGNMGWKVLDVESLRKSPGVSCPRYRHITREASCVSCRRESPLNPRHLTWNP